MFENISNSFKAKLYDFTYTPFMSSVIISWILLNHKYLLIYFADFTLDKKLLLLEKYDFSSLIFSIQIPHAYNFYFPILFGLFYTFMYPLISKYFYEFTLQRNEKLKKIKQYIIDKTPLTQEEARELRKYNNELITKNYQLERQISELGILSNKTKKNDVINDVKKEIKHKINTDDVITSKEDDRTKIERFFYESNFKGKNTDGTLDLIVMDTNIPRPKSQKILNNLIEENILIKDNPRGGFEKIIISDNGNDYLIKKFDKENKNA